MSGGYETLLLVDFENEQKVDLSGLPESTHVRIFVGSWQKAPISLVKQAHELGSRVEWIEVNGGGKNALDFHIAFYLGEQIFNGAAREYVIVSKDTGFDSLIAYMKSRGVTCRRINGQNTAAVNKKVAVDPLEAKIQENLSKIEKSKRPRKRATLKQHIASNFQQLKLADEQLEPLLESLFTNKLVTESDDVLTYHF